MRTTMEESKRTMRTTTIERYSSEGIKERGEGEETIVIERGKAVEEITLDGTGERMITISLVKEDCGYSIIEASTRVHGV